MGLSDKCYFLLCSISTKNAKYRTNIDISGSAFETQLSHLSHPTGFLCVGFLQKESWTSERGWDPTYYLTRNTYKWKSLREPKLSYQEPLTMGRGFSMHPLWGQTTRVETCECNLAFYVLQIPLSGGLFMDAVPRCLGWTASAATTASCVSPKTNKCTSIMPQKKNLFLSVWKKESLYKLFFIKIVKTVCTICCAFMMKTRTHYARWRTQIKQLCSM